MTKPKAAVYGVGAALLMASLAAGSCGGSPAAPAGTPSAPIGPTPVPGLVSVRIDVPSSISPGSSTQLTAVAVYGGGGTLDCTSTAAWTADNPAAAVVDERGVLRGISTGYVTVTAACGGVAGSAETKVAARFPSVVLYTYDEAIQTEWGVESRIELLDGPRAGEVLKSTSMSFSVTVDLVLPVRLRITAPFYAAKDFVLSESTAKGRRNPQSPILDVWIPLRFVGDAMTDTYIDKVQQGTARFPFRVGAAGPVQIRTWWSIDYNDQLTVELWCSEVLVRRIGQIFGSPGGGFDAAVERPQACEVRLTPGKRDIPTAFRLAIRYPH